MEIKNDTIFQIKTKVLLYKNKKYFPLFRNIFINNTLNYLLSKNKSHIVSNTKVGDVSDDKEKISLWSIVAKNFKKDIEIIDYDLNNFRRNGNEEKEDEYFLDYLLNQTGVIQINNLVFSYLNRVANNKISKLLCISNKDKIPLINLMKIYLGLCSQNLFSLGINNNNTIIVKRNSLNNNFLKNFSKKITKRYNTNERSINKNILNINEESKVKKIPILKLNKENSIIDKIKPNESFKKTISKNQSKFEEENDTQKNNSNSACDDMLFEQLQKSIKKLTTKNKNINSKILYSSSLARLFIGETDKESIREKYLTNFEIKKEKKLNKNKDKNLSSIFLKVFLSRLEQNKKNKLPLIEKGVENILIKFKKNQEIIDKFARLKNKTINSTYFYDNFKDFNKTTNKIGKINYNLKNMNKESKMIMQYKHIRGKKIQNKLVKKIVNKNKILNMNKIKINKINKISLSYNKIKNKLINKEKEKKKEIFDYNYNSDLKKYLNLKKALNQNDSIKVIEKEIKSKSLETKKIIKRKKDDNNIININGNLTARIKRENNIFLRYKLFKPNKEPKNKNNVINYLTKDDLFFDNL